MMMLLFRLQWLTRASWFILFMKMHLLALLQDDCLDLVHCAFLHKLSGCVTNITRASIDLEPKIRTIEKNTIFLPKKNQTFFQKKILY